MTVKDLDKQAEELAREAARQRKDMETPADPAEHVKGPLPEQTKHVRPPSRDQTRHLKRRT